MALRRAVILSEAKDLNRSSRNTGEFDQGSKEGRNEKPSVPKCSEGLWETLQSSLAVFYVEQVALNRHVSPQPQLRLLCLSPWAEVKQFWKRVVAQFPVTPSFARFCNLQAALGQPGKLPVTDRFDVFCGLVPLHARRIGWIDTVQLIKLGDAQVKPPLRT
jgi:hypothetical protein